MRIKLGKKRIETFNETDGERCGIRIVKVHPYFSLIEKGHDKCPECGSRDLFYTLEGHSFSGTFASGYQGDIHLGTEWRRYLCNGTTKGTKSYKPCSWTTLYFNRDIVLEGSTNRLKKVANNGCGVSPPGVITEYETA